GKALGASMTLLAVVDPADLTLLRSAPADPAPPGSGAAGEGLYDEPARTLTEGAAPGVVPYAPVTGITPSAAGAGSAPHSTQVIENAVECARMYLRAQASRVRIDGGEVDIEVAVGSPAEEIVAAADRLSVDLIAMATRRESALARGVLGSVTDRVIHSTSIPLLVVHSESLVTFRGNDGAPGAVIVPLDGSELSERAVPVAQSIASRVGADLLFLRAISPTYYGVEDAGVEHIASGYGMSESRQEALSYLDSFVSAAAAEGLTAESRAASGSAAGAIMDAADDAGGSLIVMGTHGRSGFKRFFLGSVTDKVVRSSGHPVLVLPPGSE
ncbi:MAG: universal stress protein, partial [Dehalococcoidia bacterium]